MSIGLLIDQLQAARERKAEADSVVKAIVADIDKIEAELMDKLAAAGIDKAAGKRASISVTETTVPQVEDWDAFYAYIKKNNYFHLLERRATAAGYRELIEMGKKVPGVKPFTKKRLNVRTIQQ